MNSNDSFKNKLTLQTIHTYKSYIYIYIYIEREREREDLAFDNSQELICHKSPTNQPTN